MSPTTTHTADGRSDAPRVSVVIVNYNVRDLLLNCVRSLEGALESVSGEVIVVDNASSDGAVAELNRCFPWITTIALEENLGFGAANNIGIERAHGEYILLLNPDTIVEEKTLSVMTDYMDRHDDVAFASSKVILPDGSFDRASKRGFPSPWSSFCRVFGLSRLFPGSRLFGEYNMTYLDPDESASVEAICGCFMFCRAWMLRELGGFDLDFFMYGEDLDLCYRARQKGWEIHYRPETTIVHIKGESTRRSSIDSLAVFYEAMEIFARKHFRSNLPLLMLVRIGIQVRRLIARVVERLPHWPLAILDASAVLIGLMLAEWMKAGAPLALPSWALPTVLVVPPVVFIATIAVAGGYRGDSEEPRGAAFGYLLGFFTLTVLFTLFKDYQFGRSLLAVSTGLGMAVGVTTRFLGLLWRRTMGAESIRRVAFLGRSSVDPAMRSAIRRAFFGRPVALVGMIVPEFSDADSVSDTVVGAVENLAKIVREHRITDVVVLDATLRYSEVTRAITLGGAERVQFHIASASPLLESLARADDDAERARPVAVDRRRRRRRRTRRVADAVIAMGVVLLFTPLVYLMSSAPLERLRELIGVASGRRPLVGGSMGGTHRPNDAGRSAPAFTVAELCGAETMSARELEQLEEYYQTNQSFLLDCEIIVAVIRQRRARRVVSAAVVPAGNGSASNAHQRHH